MKPRYLAIVSLLFATTVLASFSALVKIRSSPTEVQVHETQPAAVERSNPLIGRPNMVDRLDFYDTPTTLDRATLQHVTLATTQPTQIMLTDQQIRSFPRHGTWTSDQIDTAFEFTEFLPSWNATVPSDTGVCFEVKTRDARSGEWSPWLYMGQWGRTPMMDDEQRVLRFPHGAVNVDNLVLDQPANAYQFRATLLSFAIDRSVNPSIRRITVSYSGVVDDPAERKKLSPPIQIDGDWARSLPVPFRAQGAEVKPLSAQICSPTSTSMVMAYWGVDRPTQENALAIYDEAHDMFGNWNRAVQRAGSLGLDAWLARFRNWDQVKAMIARGQPIVAGIKFKKGEFPSSVLSATAGHLIVIRGFTKDGDVIVNDPGSRLRGNGVVYKANELAHAWFDHGGVGYVISKPGSNIAAAMQAE